MWMRCFAWRSSTDILIHNWPNSKQLFFTYNKLLRQEIFHEFFFYFTLFVNLLKIRDLRIGLSITKYFYWTRKADLLQSTAGVFFFFRLTRELFSPKLIVF